MSEENLRINLSHLLTISQMRSQKFINFSHDKLAQPISPFKNEMSEFSNTFKNIQKAASKRELTYIQN